MINFKLFFTGILVILGFGIFKLFIACTPIENVMIIDNVEYKIQNTKSTPASIELYYAIEKYSKQYNIPKEYCYTQAFLESGWAGPFHWEYIPEQISTARAYGPMQVQVPTANWVCETDTITKDDLINNIDLNVNISFKYMRLLYDRYNNWKTAYGFYHSGTPVVDNYAINIVEHKTFKWKKLNW